MSENEGVSLERIDERQRAMREDVAELIAEQQRTRRRLHDLEGLARGLVDVNRVRAEEDERRERKYTRRLNLLMALATVAAVISPLVVALIHRGS